MEIEAQYTELYRLVAKINRLSGLALNQVVLEISGGKTEEIREIPIYDLEDTIARTKENLEEWLKD